MTPNRISTSARRDFMRFVEHCMFVSLVALATWGLCVIYIPHQEGVKAMPKHKTVYDIVIAPHEYQRIKHDMRPDYTENELKHMSRMDFLQAISDAIEERLAQEKTK